MNVIYPVGYNAPNASKHIDELMARPEMLMIDTRYKPESWSPDYRKDALQEKYGKRYRWAGKYLGNLGYRDGYIKLADPDTGIRGLVSYLSKGHDLILLCQCREFNRCHMSEICNLLTERVPDVVIVSHTTMYKMNDEDVLEWIEKK